MDEIGVLQKSPFVKRLQGGVVVRTRKAAILEFGLRTLPALTYGIISYLPAKFCGIMGEGIYRSSVLYFTGEFEKFDGEVAGMLEAGLISLSVIFGFGHYKGLHICDQTLEIDSIETRDECFGNKEFYPCCRNITEDEVFEATDTDWKTSREIQDTILELRGYRSNSKREWSFARKELCDLAAQGFLLSAHDERSEVVYKRSGSSCTNFESVLPIAQETYSYDGLEGRL